MRKFAFADGAVDLASVGVAADADVEGAEAGLLWGSPLRVASRIAPAQVPNVGLARTNCLSFSNPASPRSFRKVPGFAAGDDEAVDGIELLGLFDEHHFGAELFEPAAVGVEIALQGQDSDFHGYVFSAAYYLILPDVLRVQSKSRSLDCEDHALRAGSPSLGMTKEGACHVPSQTLKVRRSNQNLRMGPKVTRRLLWAPLLK